jgi:hypothetical protein
MRSSPVAGQEPAFATLACWPREFLSLGLAVNQAQRRPSGLAKIGDFSGVFDEFGYSGGEEWI